MVRSVVLSILLLGPAFLIVDRCLADDAPAASAPSAATLKKARMAGLHAETKNGVTKFCWEDANSGSHFKTKKCVDEAGLDDVVAQRQAARDQFQQGSQCGNCGGGK